MAVRKTEKKGNTLKQVLVTSVPSPQNIPLFAQGNVASDSTVRQTDEACLGPVFLPCRKLAGSSDHPQATAADLSKLLGLLRQPVSHE